MTGSFGRKSIRERSKRVKRMERSKIREMFDRALELDDGSLVHFEIGEPDFGTPEHIVEAACEAARNGETHYTTSSGIPELRNAIGRKMRDENGVEVDPQEQVLVTCGAVEAIQTTLLAVANPGDEVILPTPAWPYYKAQIVTTGANPVEVPLSKEDGYTLQPDKICERITNDTAAILINTPNNPTGQVYERGRVEAVIRCARDHGVSVIADEVYEGLMYNREPMSIASYDGGENCVIVINSVSKKYAMTGWRIGWLAAPTELVSDIRKIHESTTACASSVSQAAAVEAIEGPQEPINEIHDRFLERRDYVVDRISSTSGIDCIEPQGAIYVFVDISGLGRSSMEIAVELLEDFGVVTTPGIGFGAVGEGYLRMSFANDLDTLEEGYNRLAEFVQERNRGG